MRNRKQDEVRACRICDDTGWKLVTANGKQAMRRCGCWYERQAGKRLDAAGIPRRYRKCSLTNFTLYHNDELEAAYGYVEQFIHDFPLVEKGILLMGGTGVGKTHLAVAALVDIVTKKGLSGRFIDTRNLLETLRRAVSANKDIDKQLCEEVIGSDLVVFDDIGAERRSPWAGERIEILVNERYNEERTTIFTTNCIDNHDPVDSLSVRVGRKLVSRLHEMCRWYEIDGPDYRALGERTSVEEIEEAAERRGLYNKKKKVGTWAPAMSIRRPGSQEERQPKRRA